MMGKGMSGMLSLTMTDVSLLHASYMPYIKGGGIFVSTPRPFQLGDEVFIRLTLMDEPDQIPITGRVVWVMPVGATRQPGIGVQFTDTASGVQGKIERYLVGFPDRDRETSTM